MRDLFGTRILMTTDAVGGVWTFATRLASALAARGADIRLVTMGPRPRADQREMLSGSPVQIIESDLALEWQDPEGADLPRARDVLLSLAQEVRPDLVHLNSYREASFDWRTPVMVTAHSCVNSWAVACGDTGWLSEPRWRRYTEHVGAGLAQASAWAAPTRAFRDVMQELYRPRSRGNVILNGSSADGERVEKEPLILAAGRIWDGAKNLAALSAVASRLEWPVVIAGAAPDATARSTARLQFTGELSHAALMMQMQRAAIFVSPARYEPFGLSVLEAAGAGCALVLSDIPTFRELWDDCAVFVDPTDAEELRAALNGVCTNAPRRQKLQQAASARARRYTASHMVDGYVQLYGSLMARPDARSPMEACA